MLKNYCRSTLMQGKIKTAQKARLLKEKRLNMLLRQFTKQKCITLKQINSYHEPRWEKLRKQALIRDGYQDRYLSRYGKLRDAEVVHHIFPVREFPEYQYCLWNLISVTRSTHNSFHDTRTDELTEKGQEVLRRLCKRRNMDIPERYKPKKTEEKKIKYLHWY